MKYKRFGRFFCLYSTLKSSMYTDLQRCRRRRSCSYNGWPHSLSCPWWSFWSAGEQSVESTSDSNCLITAKTHDTQVSWTWMETHVQLNNPQKGDEEQIERHKEEEGAPHVGDGSALRGWHQQVRGREWQRRRVGSIQGGDGREATPELPVLSTWHSCGETGNSPWNKEIKLVQTHDWESDTAGNPD